MKATRLRSVICPARTDESESGVDIGLLVPCSKVMEIGVRDEDEGRNKLRLNADAW